MVKHPFAAPPGLPALVERYKGQGPHGVRFRTPSWRAALADVPGRPARLLSDPSVTTESTDGRYRSLGDRVVTSRAVANVCSDIYLADDDLVVAAFVLVMAWGSGTTNSRSLRNTRAALGNVRSAATVLRDSAMALRALAENNSAELSDIHHRFCLPGIREPYFTKWFSFAGVNLERIWQPLILDSRVRATLHKTLGIRLNDFARERNDRWRYVAYVEAVHAWASQLSQPLSASRLEWILYMKNGESA